MNHAASACDACGCSLQRIKPQHPRLHSDVMLAAGALLGMAGAITVLLWVMGAGWIR